MADKIEALPGIKWNAQAAAASALERVPQDAPFIALWKVDGRLEWSKTTLLPEDLAFFAMQLQTMFVEWQMRGE